MQQRPVAAALILVVLVPYIPALATEHEPVTHTGRIDVLPREAAGPDTKLYVTLSDNDLNLLPDEVEKYNEDGDLVTFWTTRADEAVPFLTETGSDTGVFAFTLQLVPCEDDFVTPAVGGLNPKVGVCIGDLLAIKYDDEEDERGRAQVFSAVIEIRAWDPEFFPDKSSYGTEDSVTIDIYDPDANTDPTNVDQLAEIRVWSDSDRIGHEAVAIETGKDTGLFRLSFLTDSEVKAGALLVSEGDDLIIGYEDKFANFDHGGEGPGPENWEYYVTISDNHLAGKGNLKIIFIDVGQGDSTLIILPNEKTMLIDGGERDQDQAVLSTLQEHGIDRIDVMVATHPHADHIGGLIGVIENVDVGQVLDSGQLHTTQTFEDLLNAIDADQVPLSSVQEGDSINLDPAVALEVLNPPAQLSEDIDDELNNNSVVIKLTYGEFTALFTGDMEQHTEQGLYETNREALAADVLKAGHHGSRTSSSSEFLYAVSPKVVVISAGANNTYGHPHQEALERMDAAGVQHVLRTDIDGTIVLTTTGGSDYALETAESSKVVVVPEFEAAILIASVSLISTIVFMNSGKIWKSSRPA